MIAVRVDFLLRCVFSVFMGFTAVVLTGCATGSSDDVGASADGKAEPETGRERAGAEVADDEEGSRSERDIYDDTAELFVELFEGVNDLNQNLCQCQPGEFGYDTTSECVDQATLDDRELAETRTCIADAMRTADRPMPMEVVDVFDCVLRGPINDAQMCANEVRETHGDVCSSEAQEAIAACYQGLSQVDEGHECAQLIEESEADVDAWFLDIQSKMDTCVGAFEPLRWR